MRRKIIFVITLWLLSSLCYGGHDDDYVDPTDLFNFDPVNVRMKTEKKDDALNVVTETPPKHTDDMSNQKELPLTSEPIPLKSDSSELNACTQNINTAAFKECSNTKKSLEASISLFRQFVNKLVHMLEPKVGITSIPVEINLRLRLSYQDISKLRVFGQGGSNEIHDVHETLVYMMQHASEILPPESNIYYLDKIGLSPAVMMQILMIIMSILTCLIVLSKLTVSKRTFSNFIFLAFLVSVITTWIEMYQKEVADQEKAFMTQKLSEDCPKMDEISRWSTFTTSIFSIFSFENDKCKDYFRTLLVNPVVKVSVLQAVSVAIVNTFVTPLGIIGNGIKEFIVGLLKDFPVQYQVLMLPAFFIIVVLVLFLCYGYHLRILGLISLGPSDVRPAIQRTLLIDQQVHETNALRYHMQEQHLQQSTPHMHVVASENHSRASRVQATIPYERHSSYNSNDAVPVAAEQLTELNRSQQMNKGTKINKCNTNQTDQPKQKVVKIKHINSSDGASLSEQDFKNRQQNDDEHIKTDIDTEHLASEMKDLTVTPNTPQGHEAEIHLAAKIKSMNISTNLDQEDMHNMEQENTEMS